MATIDPARSVAAARARAAGGGSDEARSEATPTAAAACVRTTVQRRLEEVTGSLNAATGGAALCRIDGTGGSAKYLEGRTAALLAVRRGLRRSDDAAAVLGNLLERWRADLASRTDTGAAEAWLEYLRGGVAELEHLPALCGPVVDGSVVDGSALRGPTLGGTAVDHPRTGS